MILQLSYKTVPIVLRILNWMLVDFLGQQNSCEGL